MLSTLLITAAHLAALGQLESGNNDHAIGKHGEVSRYQIMPEVWRSFAKSGAYHFPCATCKSCAESVAYQIWQDRVDKFMDFYAKEPTPFQLALLWHCPNRVNCPFKSDRDYAQRFVNLLNLAQHPQQLPAGPVASHAKAPLK